MNALYKSTFTLLYFTYQCSVTVNLTDESVVDKVIRVSPISLIGIRKQYMRIVIRIPVNNLFLTSGKIDFVEVPGPN